MTRARLRVLHCIYDDVANPWVGGGGARRVLDLYRELGDDVDVTIATGAYPGASTAPNVLRLGSATSYPMSRLTYAAAASRLLRTATYDAAVVDHSAYAPVVVPRDRPVGMVVHHVTGPHARSRWGAVAGGALARLERTLLRRAHTFSATSRATEAWLRANVDPAATIMQVSSGVPDRLFAQEHRDAGYVLYVGRLDSAQKGVDVLVDAFARVVRERPDAKLRVAGRGPDADALRARAESLGVAGHIEFLGGVDDATRDALLAGASCQVVPSRFEGFGIAAAESLAAGVPLVASDDPALAEIAEGVGVVFPRDDVAALARSLVSLLGDPARCEAMSTDGRRAAERFRWRNVASDHLAFLRVVAERGGR